MSDAHRIAGATGIVLGVALAARFTAAHNKEVGRHMTNDKARGAVLVVNEACEPAVVSIDGHPPVPPAPPAMAMAIRVSPAEEAHIDAMRLRSYHLALQRRHITR